jgi:hypothetical protein
MLGHRRQGRKGCHPDSEHAGKDAPFQRGRLSYGWRGRAARGGDFSLDHGQRPSSLSVRQVAEQRTDKDSM